MCDPALHERFAASPGAPDIGPPISRPYCESLKSGASWPINGRMGPLGIDAALGRINEIRSMVGLNSPAPAAVSAAPGAFADVLAAQMGGRSGAASLDLAQYENGRLPEAALAPIASGTAVLAPTAARAYETMAAAARRDGVTLVVNDGYRSLDRQRHMAEELGLYRNGGLAAVPGTSTHGRGVSVDVDTDGGASDWLRRNAATLGFVNDVSGEPWHWTHRPSPATPAW